MTLPEIALAASARDWSDRFHRFLLDHGGATVRARVMSPDQALPAPFDVLFIDDICSFLSQGLVKSIRSRGKSVVGVFDPADGSDAKRRLLEVGITDVIESNATPEEFLSIALTSIAHVTPPLVGASDPIGDGFRIGLTGPPGGAGVTEVACALAFDLSARHRAALIDLNLTWPSIGQRLGLPVHPNLRTALDHALHAPDRLGDAAHAVDDLSVISGLPSTRGARVPPPELVGLVAGLARLHSHLVVDMGSYHDAPPELIRCLNAALIVGTGEPVGITRLVRALEEVAGSLRPECEVGIVVNKVGKSPRERDEIVAVLAESAPGLPVVLIGDDRSLHRSVWDGSPVESGSFRRSMHRLGKVFDQVGNR